MEFGKAPWTAWLDCARFTPGILEALEVLPFWIDWGDHLAQTSILALADIIGVEPVSLPAIAEAGYLAWDQASQTVTATVPA